MIVGKNILWKLSQFSITVRIPIIGPQCLQCIRTIPNFWTSMPPIHQTQSQPSNKQASKQVSKAAIRQVIPCGGSEGAGCPRGGSARGGTVAAATVVSQELWNLVSALGTTCPGTKYPNWGIPHFDLSTTSVLLPMALIEAD